MVTVEDYSTIHAEEVYEATASYYRKNGLGVGQGAKRHCPPAEHGGTELYSVLLWRKGGVTDYGLEKPEKEFPDNFAKDDWNGGFEDYMRTCAEYLTKAEAGEPVKGSPGELIVIFMLISLLVAGAVCGVLKGQMKAVR